MDNNSLTHWGIKGMKWGVRRYQNEDGSLTSDGQKRYERDQRENSGKKKGNKIGQTDPNRWVREDIERSKKLIDASSNMVTQLKNANNISIKNSPKVRADLSSMTDKEMRERINRELLERQYNDMFTPKKTSKGKEYASRILETAGAVLGVGSSALSIALAIKELRG